MSFRFGNAGDAGVWMRPIRIAASALSLALMMLAASGLFDPQSSAWADTPEDLAVESGSGSPTTSSDGSWSENPDGQVPEAADAPSEDAVAASGETAPGSGSVISDPEQEITPPIERPIEDDPSETAPSAPLAPPAEPSALEDIGVMPDLATPARSLMLMSNPMIPRDGLLVEMLFDGSAQDTSGLGNNPVIADIDSYDPSRFDRSAALPVGYGLRFDRSANLPVGNLSGSTMAVWVRNTALMPSQRFGGFKIPFLTSYFSRIESYTYGGNPNRWSDLYFNESGGICSGQMATPNVCSQGKDYLDSKWHFIVIRTLYGVGRELYVDGVFQTGGIAWYPTVTQGFALYHSNTTYSEADLRVDNFRYYNRALSNDELLSLFLEPTDSSCSDGIINQNETEVDYGGICGKKPINGLIGNYRFERDVLDSGPLSNHLNPLAKISYGNGFSGSWLVFTGSYITNPDLASSSLVFGTGMTIAFWLDMKSLPINNNKFWGFFSRGNGSNLGMIAYASRSTENNMNFGWSAAPGFSTNLSYAIPTNTSWHHVAMSFDGRHAVLWVDGERVRTSYWDTVRYPPTTASIFNAHPFVFGYNKFNGSIYYPFSGNIDEVNVYDRVLSTDEMSRLYRSFVIPETHLTLSSSSPAGGSLDVARLSPLRLEFTNPIDPATVAGNVSLRVGNTTVPTVAMLETERVLRLRPIPVETLAANTDYTVLVGTGLANLTGDRLSAPLSISFRTGTRTIDIGGLYDPLRSLSSGSIPDWDAWETSQRQNLALSETPEQRAAAGDPVDLRTGEFTYENTLMRVPGVGLPYTLSISYRSRIEREGALGHGWSASHERRIEERPDGTAVYYDERFGMHEFTRAGTGTYEYSPSYRAHLAKTATGFDLSFDDLTGISFTLSGALASIRDANNNTVAFAHDSTGRISAATDTLGHVIDYAYTASGRLASVTASGISAVAFEYSDGSGTGSTAWDLVRVRIRRGESVKMLEFGYAPDSSGALAYNLARLTDAAGHVYVENSYDSDDRVVSQRYGTGTISYEYSLGDVHADDTPESVGTGAVIGQYVAINRSTDRRGNIVEHVYDRFGNLTERRVSGTGSSAPIVTRYAYDTEHRLVSETRPSGAGAKYSYDSRGNRTETRFKADMSAVDDDGLDLVDRRQYDQTNDRPIRRIAPDGTVTDYVYDGRLRLVETITHTVRLDAGSGATTDLHTIYEYDIYGQLSRVIDPSRRETSFSYANGRPISVTRSGSGESSTETYAYDAAGNPVGVTDAAGNVRTMAYDEFDRLVTVTSAEGIVRELGYDDNDNVILERLSAGTGATRIRETVYDHLDLPVTITQSVSADISASVRTTYDAGGNIASVNLPSGIIKRYEYDASDRPTRISVQPTGSGATTETRYEYDADGNMIREIDSMGHATAYAYDGYGRLTRVTDALGNTREYSYDRLGNVTRSTAKNASGTTLEDTRAEWNAVGNLLSAATMSGSFAFTTNYAYDPSGLLLRKTDPMGRSTVYAYDGLGRLVRETDAEGQSVSTEYDARSLPITRTLSGSGGKSVFEYMAYDRDGRPVKTWRELDGHELATRYEYDAFGNVTRRIDPDGGETRYEYDLAGRLLSEARSSSGLSSTTSYAYDLSGNLLSVTDPAGNVTRYKYDGFGRRAREILPDGATTSYAYDLSSNLLSVTDPNGTVTANTYDALGRLTRRDIAAGSGVLGVTWETYSYDALGRLVGSADNLGQNLSFAYDPTGRLASETAGGLSTHYSYDASGNLQNLSYPSGLSLSMERDEVGRLLSLSSLGRQYAAYAYSGAELSGIAYSNGARTELAYDPLSRLASLSHFSATGGIIAESYSYDSEDKLLSDGSETYSYDGLDRLRRAVDTVEYDPAKRQTTSRGNQYSYDPAGNRTALERFTAVSRIVNVCKTMKVNGVNTRVCADETRESESSYVLESYSDNILNQYGESVRHPDMANRDETEYAYDANGNLVSDGTYLYGYDYRNRLVRVTRTSDNRILKEIAYDVLGRKSGWKSNSTSVRLQYAGDRMIEEYSRLHSNPYALVGSYVWGERNSDDIVAMTRWGETYYYQADRLGSVLVLTNSSGAVVERYSYDAYGVPSVWSDELGRFRSMGDSAVGNTLLYTGRPYDRIIGLYDMRARQYSPGLGRFISRDPIGMADDVNLYAYVGNSPLNYTDRFGRSASEALPASNDWGIGADDVIDGVMEVADHLMDQRFRFGGMMVAWGGAVVQGTSGMCAASASTMAATCGLFASSLAGGDVALPPLLPGATCAGSAVASAGTCGAMAAGAGVAAMGGLMMATGGGGSSWPQWSSHWGKHFPSNKTPWKKIVESTKSGPAKYNPDTKIEDIERQVWENWIPTTNWKNWKVQEFTETIWASGWKESRWVRIENTSNTIHGHPITHEEFLNLIK